MQGSSFLTTTRNVAGGAAAFLVALLAVASVLAIAAAGAGLIPWLTLPIAFGGEPVVWAGIAAQVILTLVLIAVASTLPAMLRVGRLEASHRSFQMGMDDVARAYHVAHSADREGVFRLRSEFDAVRERIAHLREHPDLGGMEPEVLELAAQMSTQTRKLAETYSDDAVSRARRFLEQRQEEVERTREAIARAHYSARELKRWTQAVEMEEQVVESQLQRLEEDMEDILPRLGYTRTVDNVVRLPQTAAE